MDQLEVVASWLVMVFLARQGVRRRRGVWTRRSWRRFAWMTAALLLAVGVGFAMAVAVDGGMYARLPSWSHPAYRWALLLLSIGGSTLLASLLAWFAFGPPEQQLHRRD